MPHFVTSETLVTEKPDCHRYKDANYREEGLQVRTKRRKKLVRPRIPMLVPDAVNQRWSMDFVSDQLANDRRFPVLNSAGIGQISDVPRLVVGVVNIFLFFGGIRKKECNSSYT